MVNLVARTSMSDRDDEAARKRAAILQPYGHEGIRQIPGLTYLPDFITEKEERCCLARIDRSEWSGELERRVQHYGYRYDYRARRVEASMFLGELPEWLQAISERLATSRLFDAPPNQVIVNEYRPGQGISPHVDCVPCFGDTIASLTLQSGCVMEFRQLRSRVLMSLWLAPCSLVVLRGGARYEWSHSIPKRMKDVIVDQIIPRGRRVSMTFRQVLR